MLKLYLVRHGETDWNAEGRLQGHSDIQLNARGQEQAQRLAERLAREGEFLAVYASPLQRAYQTAALLGRALNLPVAPDVRLLERSLGQIEGLTMNELRDKFPEVHRAWHEGGPRPHIPGEETRPEFVRRVRDFVSFVREKHAEGRVVAVTHGGTINMLLMASLGLDVEHPLPFWIDNASINLVQWGERGARLRGLNDTCHLSHSLVPAQSRPRQVEPAVSAAEAQ